MPIQEYLPSKTSLLKAGIFTLICGADFIFPNLMASFAAVRRGNDILKKNRSLYPLIEISSGHRSLDYLHRYAVGWTIGLSMMFSLASCVFVFTGIKLYHHIKKRCCPDMDNSLLQTSTNRCISFFKKIVPNKDDLFYLITLWFIINGVSTCITGITSSILEGLICNSPTDDADSNVPHKICKGFEYYTNITNSDLTPLKSLAKKVSDTQIGVGVILGLIVSTSVALLILGTIVYRRNRKGTEENKRLILNGQEGAFDNNYGTAL